MTRRAFSLLELLVVLGLFSLMSALAVLSFRTAPSSASSKSAAELLAATLRRARAEAMLQRSPVAVSLPSQAGQRPSSSGYYWLDGQDRARIRELWDLASEYPRVCIFSGFWPLVSGQNSNAPPRGGQRDDAFDSSGWTLPRPRDPALIFTPSGMVSSNGAVHFDQAYHWVVCGGVTAAPAGFAGQVTSQVRTFQASGFVDPYTVTVTFQGAVQVSRGVVNSTGLARSGGRELAPLPNLPTLGPNQDPIVDNDDVEVFPITPADSLPPGVMALVPTDRYLSIRLAARDPEGERLWIRWRLVSGGGKFSQLPDQYLPMEYSSVRRRWEANVEWRPPEGSIPGDRFEINADIRDERGAVTTIGGDVVTQLRFQASAKGTMVAAQKFSNVLHFFNPDGSGMRQMVLGDSICNLSASPDGSRMSVSFFGGGALQGKLLLINPDGTGQRLVAPPIVNSNQSCEANFASSGRLLTVSSDGLQVRDGVGTFVRMLTLGNWHLNSMWAPNEERVVYTHDNNVHIVNRDGSGDHIVASGHAAVWSPDGNRLAFVGGDGIYTCNSDGSNVYKVSGCMPDSWGNCLTWSPDGDRVAYICGDRYISIRQADGSNEEIVQEIPDTDLLLWLR